MPVREQRMFALVQYPHNAQQPCNSGQSNQKSVYRYLGPVEVIVF
jgi:hypothetical protein